MFYEFAVKKKESRDCILMTGPSFKGIKKFIPADENDNAIELLKEYIDWVGRHSEPNHISEKVLQFLKDNNYV